MIEVPDVTRIKDAVGLFAPGMILLGMYLRVQGGPTPSLQDRLLGYAVASTAYFALVGPLFAVEGGLEFPVWIWSLLQNFIVPAVLGWLLAFGSQREWQYRAAKWCGLNLSHHIPAAWDFTFSRLAIGTFVLVSLKDGSRVGGKMGRASFASSSKDERDLLIEEVWIVNDDGAWSPADPPRRALLCGGDIHYIDIF